MGKISEIFAEDWEKHKKNKTTLIVIGIAVVITFLVKSFAMTDSVTKKCEEQTRENSQAAGLNFDKLSSNDKDELVQSCVGAAKAMEATGAFRK